MKNYFQPISVLFFGLVIGLFGISAQEPEGFHFNSKMSLKIAADSTDYFQLEPINLTCSFINETDTPLTTLVPDCPSEGVLIVNSDTGKKEFGEISIFRVNLARQPSAIQPFNGSVQEVLLDTKLDEFFPSPGNYTIRLALRGSTSIQSNSIDLTIREPEGSDKAALDFLKKNKAKQQFPKLFSWNFHTKNEEGKTLLEEFVSKHGGSVYGEHAILNLARYYRATEQLAKAKIELEKLKYSKNPRIVKEAKSVL